jgi:hypothetical protein
LPKESCEFASAPLHTDFRPVFATEFKRGERQFRLHHYNQAWDYGLDLKNVHAASHNAPIFPIPSRRKPTSPMTPGSRR